MSKTAAAIIIDQIGPSVVAAHFGVGQSRISQIRMSGKFPAKWFAMMQELCAANDIACPQRLFDWKQKHSVDLGKAV